MTMADNVQLNPGAGGARLATLRDAGGNDWPTATIAYATTISDGANVLQPVTPSNGLPVAMVGAVALAAGSALVGKTAAGADGSTIYNGVTALTPIPTSINVSSSGNNQIVEAVVGKKIRVIQWNFSAHGDVVAEWRSGATTVISGPRPFVKCASAGGSPSPWGRFETAVGEALNLNLSAAVAVGGELSYVLV